MSERPFYLDARSLLSKWGFGDGDAFDDWWWDTYDEPPRPNADDILYALVAGYLMPALRDAGHDGELTRIETSHNPVRLETLDGREVDWYEGNHDLPISVEVSRAQVEVMVDCITLKHAE